MPDNNNETLDEKDLQKIKDLQTEYEDLIFELGKVTMKEKRAKETLNQVEREKNEVESQLDELNKKHEKLSRELHKKYGTGFFDSESGEILNR